MAIDFFIMPLSRYIPGDFITPTMRFAWSRGVPYTLAGKVTRQIPADEPFGGPNAPARRRARRTCTPWCSCRSPSRSRSS